MNGQWIGSLNGTNQGYVIANIDDRRTHYEGVVFVNDDDLTCPGFMARLKTFSKEKNFSLKLNRNDFSIIEPYTSQILSFDEAHLRFPNMALPSEIEIIGKLQESSLQFDWRTDVDTNGFVHLVKSQADRPSNLIPLSHVTTWKQYKEYVADLACSHDQRYLFRGQNVPKRLRTAFHRTGRADLQRFRTTDIPALRKLLSTRTKHKFDLTIAEENGAFFNLAQHHGYPTPLLDWTYSPYVSAFFAYRNVQCSLDQIDAEEQKVRIFVFDGEWLNDFPQSMSLDINSFHFSITEFMAMDNERMIPQQAITSVTNVDDIESYIMNAEIRTGRQYLKAIDLPAKDRKIVMRELSTMGVTAGSLFPGFDGACEELKERYFEC